MDCINVNFSPDEAQKFNAGIGFVIFEFPLAFLSKTYT